MKKLDSRTLRYIAHAYGKRFAGDESDPAASEVPAADDQATDDLLSSEEGRLQDNQALPTPPPGYDSSPEANPNVPISPEAVAQADLPPTDTSTPAPANTPPPSSTPDPFAAQGVPNIEGAYEEEKQAAGQSAQAQAQQGASEVKAYQQAQDALAKLPTQNDIAASYKAKDDAFQKAIEDKKIDPNRVYHNMNTGQKVLAGIGLILGGFSGAASQANPVAQMIHDAISKDIDAQKNDQSQTMSLWKMNREEYGNDLAANLVTQNQILKVAEVQLNQAASAAKGPMAAAAALNNKSLIDKQLAENRFKLSLMQPTSDSIGLDPAKKVSWLVPPAQQAKVFDEIDAAQNTTRNAPAILDAFDQASKEVRPLTSGIHTSGTAFVPGMDSPGQKALHAQLGPTFKDVEGTVRQAAMDNMFKNTTPQFGDGDSTIASKRASLINYMTAKSSAPTASGSGINLSQYPSTNVKGALPPAPGSAAAKQKTVQQTNQAIPQGTTKSFNGANYTKVPGGWQKIQANQNLVGQGQP